MAERKEKRDDGTFDPYNSTREGSGVMAPRERGPLEIFRKAREQGHSDKRPPERQKRIKFEIEGESAPGDSPGMDPYNSSSTGSRTSSHKR